MLLFLSSFSHYCLKCTNVKLLGKEFAMHFFFIPHVLFDVSALVAWHWVVAVMVYIEIYEPWHSE